MTYTVLAQRPATTTPPHVTLATGWNATNREGLIFEVPAGQEYFWSRTWQADERIAVAELACGEGREFESTDDALAWLFGPED